MALKRLCKCGKVIDHTDKYCDECKATHKEDTRQRHKEYNMRRRDTKYEDFYKSIPWERTREYTLDKHKGLDIYDYYINNKLTYANTVHHIVELKEDWNKRLDLDNLFPLSKRNHKLIHDLYKKDKKKEHKTCLKIY